MKRWNKVLEDHGANFWKCVPFTISVFKGALPKDIDIVNSFAMYMKPNWLPSIKIENGTANSRVKIGKVYIW